MWADADSSCTESCTDSWRHWLGSLCAQAARRILRSSSWATNSACCADRSTDPSSPTPTGACSGRSRPRDRAEPGGWSPPTHCWVGTAAASPGTGLNHSDRRAGRRPQRSFADSRCASQPRIQPGDVAASRATRQARPPPRCVHGLADPQQRRNRPRPHTLGSHLVAVPAVPGRRRLRLHHHRNRHAAQVLPAVVHRHPHANRVHRRDHRPPQRHLGHPSRPEPAAPIRPPTRRRPGARARPRQPVHRRLRRDLQNRTYEDPQDTCTHPRGERVRRTLDRHPATRTPRPHHHLEPSPTQQACRRLHRSLQHGTGPTVHSTSDHPSPPTHQTSQTITSKSLERPVVADSSTSTEMPPDQTRHSLRHPQARSPSSRRCNATPT